ncbi:MAG TPA: surface-adhesin E family protein, partial [Burkholderiales bacterium]|nr:surface-adhesin E family protein [Burkholderiales bacterium]
MLPRRLLCGLLALGFLAAAATAGAENWKQIGVDKYRNIWQVDLESVREANSFTTGWIRKLFREPQRDREGRWYSSSVEGWAVDCKARSTAITGVV